MIITKQTYATTNGYMRMGTGRILQKTCSNTMDLLGKRIVFTIHNSYSYTHSLRALCVHGYVTYLRKSHTEFSENNVYNIMCAC